MKKEEAKPEESKEVSTLNLIVMMPGKANLQINIVFVTDLTVFNNEMKTGSS